MNNNSVWRDLILGYRKKHALTQADAALRLNVSQQTISRWESGKQEPDPEAQAALRLELGVLALTLRDSWIQRIQLSAGREFLFEKGWRLIAASKRIVETENFKDPNFIGKPLRATPILGPLQDLLETTALFEGGAKLVRIQCVFHLDARSVGRIFDLWPILTGTDELLVHAAGYPFAASGHEQQKAGLQILDTLVMPVEPHETPARHRSQAR